MGHLHGRIQGIAFKLSERLRELRQLGENEKSLAVSKLLGILRDKSKTTGHNASLGILLDDHGVGWAEFHLDWRADLVADAATGILASGPIISLMDTACGAAVWTAVPNIATSVTLDLRVDYLRPARPTKRVFGRGECYHLTRRIAFVRGMAHDGERERPVANVTGTFVITRNE